MHWKLDKSMIVGIEQLDKQHQIMVDMLNRMSIAIIEQSTEEVIEGLLTDLQQYTCFHFSSEEEQFRCYAYPDALQHAAAHQTLIEKIDDINTRYQRGEIDLSTELMDLLTDWVFGHIKGSDMRFKAYLERYCTSQHS